MAGGTLVYPPPAWYPSVSFFTRGARQVDNKNKAYLQQVEGEMEQAKVTLAEKIRAVIQTQMRSKTSVFQTQLS